ncbi:MAG: hypothetical protein QF787_14740, partial [Nitrospinota bacterium]|nr:hypothetical protein [Nitrospinota bacterium]
MNFIIIVSGGFFGIFEHGRRDFLLQVIAKQIQKVRRNFVEFFVQRGDDRFAIADPNIVKGARSLLGPAYRIDILGQYAVGQKPSRPQRKSPQVDHITALHQFLGILFSP